MIKNSKTKIIETTIPKIMTATDLANFLKMKISWVRQRVHRGEIPYFKIGNLVRFNQNEVIVWLETKKG